MSNDQKERKNWPEKRRAIDEILSENTLKKNRPSVGNEEEERKVFVDFITHQRAPGLAFVDMKDASVLRAMLKNAMITKDLCDTLEAAMTNADKDKSSLDGINAFFNHYPLPTSYSLVSRVGLALNDTFPSDEGRMSVSKLTPASRERLWELFSELKLDAGSDSCWRHLKSTDVAVGQYGNFMQQALRMDKYLAPLVIGDIHMRCPQVIGYSTEGVRNSRFGKSLYGATSSEERERKRLIVGISKNLGYLPHYLLDMVSAEDFLDFKAGEVDYVSLEEWFNESYFTWIAFLNERRKKRKKRARCVVIPEDVTKVLGVYRERAEERKLMTLILNEFMCSIASEIVAMYVKALYFNELRENKPEPEPEPKKKEI